MTSFNILTYNCKGLQQKSKRNKLFNYISDKIHNGILFLQETHSTPECEEKWKKEWGGEIYFSHGSSNSTGAAIFFLKSLIWTLLNPPLTHLVVSSF